MRIPHSVRYPGFGCSDDLFSRAVSGKVSSARTSLTSVFGMGTGGTSPPLSPQWYIFGFLARIYLFFFPPLRQIDNCIEHLQDHICQAYFQFALFSSLRDQALDLLVSVGSTHHCAYTPDLSTSSSIRGLTNLCYGISYLEASFTLRCFQRLSHPHFAFLPCRWRDNRCTIGAFIPVLSY